MLSYMYDLKMIQLCLQDEDVRTTKQKHFFKYTGLLKRNGPVGYDVVFL